MTMTRKRCSVELAPERQKNTAREWIQEAEWQARKTGYMNEIYVKFLPAFEAQERMDKENGL